MKKRLSIQLKTETRPRDSQLNISNQQSLCIAIVGSGQWMMNLMRNYHKLGVLSTVCNSAQKIPTALKKQYTGVHFTAERSDVFNNPDIDGVVIATPALTHYELAKQALLTHKNVFVEKPFALKIEDAEELITLADRAKRTLMVGHILRYHPAISKLKELIDTGVLGSIKYIYSRRLNIGKIRTEENILWSFAPDDISVIHFLLNENPQSISAHGSAYVKSDIADVTVTMLNFPSGVKCHIFVSWLHPFKEQKLVIVGGKKMAVFDDLTEEKLFLYPHKIEWQNRIPVAHKADVEIVKFEMSEPLKIECQHFLDCIRHNKTPMTDGNEGLRVLKILTAAQQSLWNNGQIIDYNPETKIYSQTETAYFVHPTAFVGDNCMIGRGTKIWNNSQIQPGAQIGENCTIGHNCFVGSHAKIGNGVKLECNIDVWDLVTLEDYVFVGPSAVFTNDVNPRAKYSKKDYPQYGEWIPTLVKEGASIGANATIVCGTTIGKGAMIGAGAVVNKNIPDYAIAVGIPAKITGWICECGSKLRFTGNSAKCRTCSHRYLKKGKKVSQVT